MLYGLAESSNAPKFLAKLSGRKVPVNGILISSAITLLVVALNFFFPGQIFMYLMSIVTGAVVLSWALIVITHIKFRQHCESTGHETKFKSLFYPFANYICLAFLIGIIILMTTIEEMRLAVMIIPIWIAAIYIGYRYKNK